MANLTKYPITKETKKILEELRKQTAVKGYSKLMPQHKFLDKILKEKINVEQKRKRN